MCTCSASDVEHVEWHQIHHASKLDFGIQCRQHTVLKAFKYNIRMYCRDEQHKDGYQMLISNILLTWS